MSSTRAECTSEEIWLEVDRLVRKAHVKVVVPLPVVIPDELASEQNANWTMPLAAVDATLAQAVAEVQARWNLLDARPPTKPTRSATELQALVNERVSQLPNISGRVPAISGADIVPRQYAGAGQANWSVPRITSKRSCRHDVAVVIGAIQRQFDLAAG